jgi:hypothetical protein
MTFITFNRIAIDGMAYDKTKGFFVSLGAGVSLLATAYMTLKITVVWEEAPCSLTVIYRSLLRSCCLHQGRSCAPMRGGIGISRNVGTRLPQYATSHPRGWHVRRAAQFITLLDWVTFCDQLRIASQLFGVSANGLSCAHSETGQMAVCCQNLTLGALSSRSAFCMLVGALFKKFGLFLNRGGSRFFWGFEVIQFLGSSWQKKIQN